MENIKEILLENIFVKEILANPLWQWIGILAMIFSILWYTQKDDKKTLQIFLVSNFVWMLHFYFMATFSAMISCGIAIARCFFSLKYKRNKKIFFWVLAAVLISWVMTYENKLSILPMIASVVSAYWFFFLEKIKLRLFMLISSICWVIFSFWTFSIWWIISDSIVLVVLIFTMIKMIKDEHKETYFRDKIMWILRKSKPDLWRFISFYDIVKLKKKSIFEKIKSFKNFFRKKQKKYYLFKKWKFLYQEK